MTTILATLVSTMDPGDLSFANWGKGRVVRDVARFVEGLAIGSHTGSIDVQLNPAYGGGVLSMSSGSGSVGGSIGGRSVTVTWATSDAASCDALAAAILADATANTYVTAASRAATGTVTVATGSGLITATINGVAVSVTWATSDTATATALAAAINATANLPVIASSSAGVVTLYSTLAGSGATNTAGNGILLAASGTGATASGAKLTGGGTNANALVLASIPGTIGNGITLSASGTGVTASTGARLVGGIGAPGNSFTV